jgi:hypothetical protein
VNKPKIIVERKVSYTFRCPICREEHWYEEDARDCLDKCYKKQLEEEKILREKEALAPLKGQIDFYGQVI